MTKLVILDRDGVINEDRDDFVKSVDEWVALPGSMDAIAFLNQADFRVVVATNQSGIGRGFFTIHDLNEMHARKCTAWCSKQAAKLRRCGFVRTLRPTNALAANLCLAWLKTFCSAI